MLSPKKLDEKNIDTPSQNLQPFQVGQTIHNREKFFNGLFH
jgi:hypothetical protein